MKNLHPALLFIILPIVLILDTIRLQKVLGKRAWYILLVLIFFVTTWWGGFQGFLELLRTVLR